MQQDPKIEFSRIISFEQIGVKGIHCPIEAREEECILLSRRFHLVAINHLSARFFLEPAEEAACYQIKGTLNAQVVQSCISTMKEVPAQLKISFQILLRPSGRHSQDEEFEIDLESEVDTEYYTTETIDLGETAAQYLYINLEPFPRSPDAPSMLQDGSAGKIKPFSLALKSLVKEK